MFLFTVVLFWAYGRVRINYLDVTCALHRQELQSLRKDNAGLDSNYHEQDKLIAQLKTRLAVLEQEVKDKEEVKRKTADLYSSEQEHKVCWLLL